MVCICLSYECADELYSGLEYLMSHCDVYAKKKYGTNVCVEAVYNRLANIYVTLEDELWKEKK